MEFDKCKVIIRTTAEAGLIGAKLTELGYNLNIGGWGQLHNYGKFRFYIHESNLFGYDTMEHDTWIDYKELSVKDIINYEKHDFMWAVGQMKSGKKVRRKKWDLYEYIYIKQNSKTMSSQIPTFKYTPYIESINATDWEIYEEPKKTLWDKVLTFENDGPCTDYDTRSEDIKETLAKCISGYHDERAEEELKEHLKEFFGKEFFSD